ncbi:MAG TPA: DUF429 domain-containing protein [Candidatus Binatia bacterium]|nr:DUF429 domain-containing protein [Candidatus Binatia bacterium]
MAGGTTTVGVDVSSQPAGTAACRVRWPSGRAVIDSVEAELDDSRLAAVLTRPAAKLGLDVPLGWPDGFVGAVSRHHSGQPFGEVALAHLVRRETDIWVWEQTKQLPLSVTTDRIAYPAMRIARLLGQLRGGAVERSGTGRFVEVYPAVALRAWDLRHRSYKREAGRSLLAALLEELRRRCPWLQADEATWAEVGRTDHAFDALISALVARAHQRGLCHPIPAGSREAAAREGWIAVPVPGSLERLVP